MPFEAAVVLAYMVGMVFAFFLFQKLMFGGSGELGSRRIFRFVQVNLLGAGLAWTVSSLMAPLALPEGLARAVNCLTKVPEATAAEAARITRSEGATKGRKVDQ
ncbi:MAG: GtrA family protein, partial [Hyphomonadaceae bacterium]